MRQPPAYQEYPSDLLANENYRLMSLEERGLFHTLRHYCWVNGSTPASVDELAELLGITCSHLDQVFSMRVKTFFHTCDVNMGRLVSPELRDYKRELVERSIKKSLAGKLGGQKSAEARTGQQATVERGAQASPESSRAEPELNSGEQGWGERGREPF